MAMAMSLASLIAQAGQLVWSPPHQFVYETAETFLDNIPGTIVGVAAFNPNFGNQAVALANQSFTITSDGSVASVTGNGYDTNYLVDLNFAASGSPIVDGALATFSYDGGPKIITLTNLASNVLYTVQIFSLDNRSGNQQRGVGFQSVGGNTNGNTDLSTSFDEGACDYIIGAFVTTNTYQRIQLNCYNEGSGNLNLVVLRTNVNAGQYFIGQQPVQLKQFTSTAAKFSIQAAGSNLTYQWQRGDAAGSGLFTNLANAGTISGVTTSTLQITSLNVTNTDDYRVVVTYPARGATPGGSYTSGSAHLLCLAPYPQTYAATVMSLNPIAYYRLDETGAANEIDANNTGSVLALDYANGHNGLYGGANAGSFPLVTYGVTGPQIVPDGYATFGTTNLSAAFAPGSAISDAVLNNILIPPLNQSLTQTNYTICMWLNPSANPPSYCGLFMTRNGTDDYGFTMAPNGNDLGYNWDANNGSAWGYDSQIALPQNQWSFVAMVITNQTATFWLLNTNGFYAATNALANIAEPFNGGWTWIGGDPNYDASRSFPGSIDEVSVFNYSMTPAQIQQLYVSAISTVVPPIITGQPQSVSNYQVFNYSATLSPSVIGTAPLSYQWYQSPIGGPVNWVPVAGNPNVTNGSTNVSLTFSVLDPDDVANYELVISNVQGVATTAVASVTLVTTPPYITWQGPTPIPSTASAALEIPGTTIVGAEAFGPEGEQVVTLPDGTGIDFKNDGTWGTIFHVNTPPAPYNFGTANGALNGTAPTANATWNTVLDNYDWDGGPKQITINNLTVGVTYSVQLFGLDLRTSGGDNTRTVWWSNPNDTIDESPQYQMGNFEYTIATFTATNTSVVIQENLPTSSSGNMNALVIRTNGTAVVAPTIVSQPATVTANYLYYTNGPLRKPSTLSVLAAGTALTYQWQYSANGISGWVNLTDGGIFAGSQTPTLSVADVGTNYSGYFQCIVSGTLTSTVASVNITQTVFTPTSIYETAILNLNPVAYYRLDEPAGSTTAFDSWGSSVGTFGSTALSGVAGPSGTNGGYWDLELTNTALQDFRDGTSSVTVTGLAANSNQLTVIAWVNPTNVQNTYAGIVFNRYNAATGLGFGGTTSGTAGSSHGQPDLVYNWNNDGWQASSGLYLPTNEWSMVAMVVYGTNTLDPSVANSSGDLYLINTNGFQEYVVKRRSNTSFTSTVWSGGTTYIGCDPNNQTSRAFLGEIDEVTVFTQALTTAQITALYNAAVAPTISITPIPGGQVQVSWPGGSLLQASSVTGPWTTNLNTSPYVVTPSAGSGTFYKLQAH